MPTEMFTIPPLKWKAHARNGITVMRADAPIGGPKLDALHTCGWRVVLKPVRQVKCGLRLSRRRQTSRRRTLAILYQAGAGARGGN